MIKFLPIKHKLNKVSSGLNYIKATRSQANQLNKIEKNFQVNTEIQLEKHHFNAWNALVSFNGGKKSIVYHFYTNLKTFYLINFPYHLINLYLTKFPSEKLLQTHELFMNFLKLYPNTKGSFLMSWHDIAKPKNTISKNCKFITFTCLKTDPWGLCIVDDFFLRTKAYSQFRQQVERHWLSWDKRTPTAFWRGASTGSVLTKANWQDNRRVRLCQIAKRQGDEQFIDAKITKLVQIKEAKVKKMIQNENLVGSYVPTIEFLKYKYVIDIDGNSNSWPGLFTKLIMGSCILKVESQWKQWYYDDLKPWVNYIPVKQDLSDLIEKINWCREHDKQARIIGENARKLALSMTMETESRKAYATIIEALK